MSPGDRLTAWQEADGIRPLAPHEFEQIRQLARRTFGLDLKAGKEELVSSRLRKLVRDGGFRSFHDYYRHIVDEPSGLALATMIDALATNHTSFNREPAHFDFLCSEVVPHLRPHEPVEIWTAACSTGEEVWTLAAVLNEAFPGRPVHLTATDISNRALRFAECAVYSADHCQSIPQRWLSQYFEPADTAGGRGWRVNSRLRSQATFRRVNLVERYSWPRRFPIIFCRNVMIYFDNETQTEVVRQLAEWLEPGGYLFVGHAESLTRISHPLEYVRPAVYRKPAQRENRWRR